MGGKDAATERGAGAEQASEENFNVRRLSHADSSLVEWAPCFVGLTSPRRPRRGKSGPRQTRSPRTAEMTKVVQSNLDNVTLVNGTP
jgi:hypothetical protein